MNSRLTDHVGRRVVFRYPPERIVSLCPSLTETFFALGLDDRIVGRTVYCTRPPDRVRTVPTVGGTIDVDTQAVAELSPDLIVAQKEENARAIVEDLSRSYPVYVVNVESYDDALRTIADLGDITGQREQALRLVANVKGKFADLTPIQPKRVAYLVWNEPYMAAGSKTYIDSLLEMCGLTNVCKSLRSRYPKLTPEDLRTLAPEVVMLSSEPFPFDESHADELRTLLPEAAVLLVDGELMSWFGPRMLDAPVYLARLLDRIS